MAFNLSTQVGRLLQAVGQFSGFAVGMVTMSSGAATVTIPGLSIVHGIIGTVQGATGVGETVICTATAGNTASLETIAEGGTATGSSVVMFIAWGIPKA
jgi:hypothetical protein